MYVHTTAVAAVAAVVVDRFIVGKFFLRPPMQSWLV